jgi:hypothetical protein
LRDSTHAFDIAHALRDIGDKRIGHVEISSRSLLGLPSANAGDRCADGEPGHQNGGGGNQPLPESRAFA